MLQRLVEGTLGRSTDREWIAGHVARCAECRRNVCYLSAAFAALRMEDARRRSPVPPMLLGRIVRAARAARTPPPPTGLDADAHG